MGKKLALIFLLLICSCSVIWSCSGGGENSKRTNLILIVVDTLGAEHISPYNTSLKHTPNLQRMADEGLVFDRAYTAAPWTKASIASMFTSLWPSEHHVEEIKDVLAKDQDTLAEILKSAGYATSGVISHTLITKKHGFSQGFDRYKLVDLGGNPHQVTTSDKVTTAAIDSIRGSDKPFFKFIHYFDPHFNYQHHQEFNQTSGYKGRITPGMDIRELRKLIPTLTKKDIEYLVGLYHEEIAYTDKYIGELLNYIRTSPEAKNTLVILTADHGEEFMRHGGLGHTHTLYDELIHVPLIVWQPGTVKTGRIKAPVSLVDLLPTVVSYLGVSAKSEKWRGIDLQSTLRTGVEPEAKRNLFAEVDFNSSNIKAHKKALSVGAEKLILDIPTKTKTLFDRATDPDELKDLSRKEVARVNALSPVLEDHGKGSIKPAEGTLNQKPEEIEQLKSLGYM